MHPNWISSERPALVLAPMEGITDAPMRALLTENGGFSFCVSEFIRVSQDVLPSRTFLQEVPELKTASLTASGIPVQIQLLGGHPERVAQSAVKAIQAGALGIDLNFGCPAPSVNRNDGGAALLRFPNRIRDIVSTVRRAVPSTFPVSAKLRLGWDNPNDIFVNAEQAALGGASWLTIHARTKTQGYAPPAHWDYIRKVSLNLRIPVVANGEIWTKTDFLRCREITEAQHFMIGRGALADPSLPLFIANELGIYQSEPLPSSGLSNHLFDPSPKSWEPLFRKFTEIPAVKVNGDHYSLCRVKQWLRFAQMKQPLPWADNLKRTQTLEEFFSTLQSCG